MSEPPNRNVTSDVWSKVNVGLSRFDNDGPSTQGGRVIVDRANAYLPFTKATSVIDIGCGTGSVVGELLKAYSSDLPKEARVIASDFSSGTIEQVRQRQARSETWARIELQICDATDLSTLSDGSISHVLSGYSYYTMPDSRPGLAEALRVLQPGGVFASSSMAQAAWADMMSKFGEVREGLKGLELIGPWGTEEEVKNQLTTAGFKDVEAYSFPIYMPFDDDVDIVDFLLSTLPCVPRLSKDLTAKEMAKVRDLMIQSVKDEYPNGKLPGVAIVGVGRK